MSRYGKTYRAMQDDLDDNEQLNGVTPKFVSERPELCMWSRWVYTDFERLSRSRSSGMGLGSIPLSEIINYFDRVGFYDNDLEKFIEIIQAIDETFINEKDTENGNKT